MKVRVIHDFRDKTAELQLRKKGETLDVDARRAEYLADLGLVEKKIKRRRQPSKVVFLLPEGIKLRGDTGEETVT